MGKKIAITGGIGSGKSYVAEYIKNLGYPVFSCDEIYKDVSQSLSYIEKLQTIFPECVIGGKLDRRKLASIVFFDEKQLKKLNAISHPLIMEKLYEEMDKAEGDLIFAEVPLLFEGGFEKDFHETIFVKRNLEARVQGIIQRDKIGESEALQRIQNQYSLEYVESVIQRDDIPCRFIDNNGTLNELKIQIDAVVNDIKTSI
ncbi:MAG: dephospho-CoA kinase [Clostridia bacterium]|nr:dephospho-CoA kinase [Clostridia bacterium]